MSDIYTDKADGEILDYTWYNSIQDALGAIAGTGTYSHFHPAYIVFKVSSTYYVRNGANGTIESGGESSSAATSIQWALDNLTSGRDWMEVVTLKGDFDPVSTNINPPNYSIVDARGARLTLDDSVDKIIFYLNNVNDAHIIGGYYEGNSATNSNSDVIKILGGSTHCSVRGAHVTDSSFYGITINGATTMNNSILNCTVDTSFHHGICVSGGIENIVANNHVIDNGRHGIALYPSTYRTLVTGNHCTVNGDSSSLGTGITAYSESDQNIISNNYCEDNYNAGIRLDTGADENTVINNICRLNHWYGIDVYRSSRNIISGNLCISNGTAAADTYPGIMLRDNSEGDCLYNVVTGNNCYDVQGSKTQEYGIQEAETADYNIIRNNILAGNSLGCISIVGAHTQVHSISFPFVDGTSAEDEGWDIDANTEYARGYGSIPYGVQAVVRARINAHSVVTETDAMRLEIIIEGGAENEAKNTHSYTGADVPSTSTNFAADDNIYWAITDANVLALVGGDIIKFKVLHEAAGGDDCETDARFKNLTIDYV